jgi:hypothetical protein
MWRIYSNLDAHGVLDCKITECERQLFMPPRSKIGKGGIVFVLSVCPSVINLRYLLLALIFHMNISCDKTFPWKIFDLVTLVFDLLIGNFNLGFIF